MPQKLFDQDPLSMHRWSWSPCHIWYPVHTPWVLSKSNRNPTGHWMHDSYLDAYSVVSIGATKIVWSGSHINALVELIPLSHLISCAYPLSFVQVKSESHRTLNARFPLRCIFCGKRWCYKKCLIRIPYLCIGGVDPPITFYFLCIAIEICASQIWSQQDIEWLIAA